MNSRRLTRLLRRSGEERRRHFDAQGTSGLHVDDEVEAPAVYRQITTRVHGRPRPRDRHAAQFPAQPAFRAPDGPRAGSASATSAVSHASRAASRCSSPPKTYPFSVTPNRSNPLCRGTSWALFVLDPKRTSDDQTCPQLGSRPGHGRWLGFLLSCTPSIGRSASSGGRMFEHRSSRS